MSLFRINLDKVAVEDVSQLFPNAATAMESYGGDVLVLEAPSQVRIGWTWDGSEWHEPMREGYAYDRTTDSFYLHEEYRRILHERTTNDTMQAYRKLRQGDKTIDWQVWLDALDAYNVEIEKTKEQETYPLKVTYPEYPIKPTPQ